MYKVEGTVPSVVLDPGSHTIKAGTAGEDLPHVLLPAVLSRSFIPDQSDTLANRSYSSTKAGKIPLTHCRTETDIVSPFDQDGLVSDWALFEDLIAHVLDSALGINTKENALLIADPNHNGRKARERLVEMAFEKFSVPAFYLSRSAVLSAYANSKTTGVVLDVGHSGTSAVPVEDGVLIKGKCIRTNIGGRRINEVLAETLSQKDIRLRPVWSYEKTITGRDGADEENMVRQSEIKEVERPGVSDSFWGYSRTSVLEEIKASVCVVHENPSVELAALPVVSESFELPDGNTINLGTERFAVAEKTIFGNLPHLTSELGGEARLSYVNQYLNGANGNGSEQRTSAGIHGLVVDAIKMCHESVHRDMYAGVCLTGGTSDMAGLMERLNNGLLETYHKVRVLASPGSTERKYCAWTGGSILASFSEFQKMWFSKSEYEENGSSFVHRKCQ